MKYLVFSLMVLIFMATDCLADTIFLKNKDSINGIVIKDEEGSVAIDVGFGTVVLPRAEIESIKKSSEAARARLRKEWQKSHFKSFPAPTTREQELVDNFEKLIYKKRQIRKNNAEKENIAGKISALRKDISRLQDEIYALSEKIEFVHNKKNIKKYNFLITKYNSFSNELKEAIDKLDKLQIKYEEANEEVVKYINQFMRLEKLFETKYDNLITLNTLSLEQKYFYRNLKERLNELQKDIKQQRVKFARQKGHIVIEAIINDKVEVMMMVDTGATLTVISKEVAERLEIDYDKLKEDVKLIGVSGQSLSAKFIILKSIKIGDVEGKNIEAVIVKDKTFKDVDGFLGMSFLKKFSFSMDKKKQSLVFNFFE